MLLFEVERTPFFSKFSKNNSPYLEIRSMKNFGFVVWGWKRTCVPIFITFWKGMV